MYNRQVLGITSHVLDSRILPETLSRNLGALEMGEGKGFWLERYHKYCSVPRRVGKLTRHLIAPGYAQVEGPGCDSGRRGDSSGECAQHDQLWSLAGVCERRETWE